MVTPDGVSAPSEALDRRSLTAAAIRRGDVKISEPIPWETEPHLSPSSSLRKPPTANRPDEVGAPKTNAAVTQRRSDDSDADEGEEAPRSFEGAPLSQPLRHKTASLSMREDSEVQGQATPLHQRKRESGFTESPTGSANQMQSKKKRRSGTGTIRTVFRRLFSKRDKASSSRYVEDKKSASPRARQHGYHRSDPLPKASNRGVGDTKASYRDRASDSPAEPIPVLPANEYPPSTPVQQRLPFPMNVNAPQQDSPSPRYTNFNSPLIHRRRATLPSVVISGGDAVAIRELMGWTKHDANSTHPTDRNASHRTPTPLIGLAVTSGANPNRRSRSAGALYDIAREQDQAEQRRRSAEVQYWSQSRVALDHAAVAVANQPEVIKSPESRADMDQGSFVSDDHHSGTEISAALADAGSSIRDEPEIHTHDFGAAAHPTTEGMMGTPEAEAQPTTTEDAAVPGTVLDQRLSQIEDNMRALTSSIHELTGRAHRHTVVLESAPRGNRDRAAEQKPQPPSPEQQQQQPPNSKPQRTPSRRFQQPSPPSSGASIASASAKGATHVPSGGYVFVGTSGTGSSSRPVTYQQESHFLSPASLSFSPEPTTPELSTRERELQMQYAQYRPETSNIAPALPSPSIYTHLAPLYSALHYERSQRKAMEARITHLSRQVSELRATVTNMRSAEVLTRTQASRFSGYDDDSGDEAEPREEPVDMVTPMEEWTTPTQDWPGRSADPQFVDGGVGGAALGSPIEGEMF